MKKILKVKVILVSIIMFSSCGEDSLIGDQLNDLNNVNHLAKEYSYNIEDIYTVESSKELFGRSTLSLVTHIVPTVYKGESYDFEVTTLIADGKEFNVTFDRNGTTYSVDYLIQNNRLFPLTTSIQNGARTEQSFGSCISGHEGAGYALLTGACATITAFIPFMQTVVFACAAETAVIAGVIAADCAINND